MHQQSIHTLGKVAGYSAEEQAALQAQYGEESPEHAYTATQKIRMFLKHIKALWQQRANVGDTNYPIYHAEFLPAALEIQQTPPNATAKRIGQLIILVFVLGILWASIGKVDVMAVAEGKIIPSTRIKHIQPLDKGVVSHIYVSEGQHVKKGEKLIALDKTLTKADQTRLSAALQTSLLDEQRQNHLIQLLQSNSHKIKQPNNIIMPTQSLLQPNNELQQAIANQYQQLQQQWQQYIAQLAALKNSEQAKQAELETTQAQIEKLQQTLPIVNQRATNYKKLVNTHMVAEDEYLKIEQERIEQQQTLQSLLAQSRQLQANLAEIVKRQLALQAETLAQTYQQLSETTQRRQSLQQELAKAQDVNAKQILYAPVEGVVQELKINTIGGVVTEAQDVMSIVPSNEQLEVQAFIDNKDIGFIHADMPAEIKIQTFPFTQYGVINATVKAVTEDALANQEKGLFFAMQLVLEKNTIKVNGKQVALRPGMQVTAEVKTGKRRIIEYLLTPVMKGFKESVRER